MGAPGSATTALPEVAGHGEILLRGTGAMIPQSSALLVGVVVEGRVWEGAAVGWRR